MTIGKKKTPARRGLPELYGAVQYEKKEIKRKFFRNSCSLQQGGKKWFDARSSSEVRTKRAFDGWQQPSTRPENRPFHTSMRPPRCPRQWLSTAASQSSAAFSTVVGQITPTQFNEGCPW
jgi:hypothetical protein